MAAPPKPGAGIPTPALDDHRHHRADLLEGFLARGAPGGGAVVEQRRAVRVPRYFNWLDNDREVLGAFFPAHAARLASLPLAVSAQPLEMPAKAMLAPPRTAAN